MGVVFNGKDLSDYKCLADERETPKKPEQDVESVEIPGKNGTITFSNHRYKNIEISYSCAIKRNFEKNYSGLMAFLLKDTDYHVLEGNAEKDFFRVARFAGSSDPEVGDYFTRGTFTLTFDCKPQRWLKAGYRPVEFAQSGEIHNIFLYDSLPLIRVYGYGTLTVGSGTVTVAQNSHAYVDIDCDIKDAFCGTENCNSLITVSSWPTLEPGDNAITLPSTMTKVEITPRWWSI